MPTTVRARSASVAGAAGSRPSRARNPGRDSRLRPGLRPTPLRVLHDRPRYVTVTQAPSANAVILRGRSPTKDPGRLERRCPRPSQRDEILRFAQDDTPSEASLGSSGLPLEDDVVGLLLRGLVVGALEGVASGVVPERYVLPG